MALTGIACRFTDGRVIADLPTLDPQYPVRHTLSTYDTARAYLNLEGAPNNWRRATLPFGSWICFYDDEDPDETPQWVGTIVNRTPSGTESRIPLDLVTAEGYADRRYVRDETHTTAEGRNAIIASTVPKYLVDGATGAVASGLPGFPITAVQLGGAGPHPAEDLVWQNADNVSCLGRWLQVIGQLGGEFTIEWDWVTADDGAKALAATLKVGDRIGNAALPGFGPVVTFDMPGPLTSYSEPEDYSAGKGANVVTAYSSGQGETVPFAPDVVAADFGGRGAVEFRWQPAPSISPTALAQYGQQWAPILLPGQRVASLGVSLSRSEGRRFGRDWRLGDDIGWNVKPIDEKGAPILAFPKGTSGVGRTLAVELTSPTVLTPILGVPVIPGAQ